MKKLLLVCLIPACTNDPTYVQPPRGIEVGATADDMGVATETFLLPFDTRKLNGMDYARERNDVLIEINQTADPDITLDQLALVRLEQLDVSLEWTIRNLSEEPGQARIHVNGGNQYFVYVPGNFIVDPEDEEEAVPPPLAGNVPIDVPAGADVGGVFREDQLREAALDLELITRAGMNPFAAMLNIHEDISNTSEITIVPYPPDQDPPPVPPPPMPVRAFSHLVQFDITFQADQHMVLEYAVRVRDPDGLLHDELTSAPAGELHMFAPGVYTPPAAP